MDQLLGPMRAHVLNSESDARPIQSV